MASLYTKIFILVVPAHLCEGVCECGGNQAQDNEDLHGLVWFEGGKLKAFQNGWVWWRETETISK